MDNLAENLPICIRIVEGIKKHILSDELQAIVKEAYDEINK